LCIGFCCPSCEPGQTCMCEAATGQCDCINNGGPGGGGYCRAHQSYDPRTSYCGSPTGGGYIPWFNTPHNECCFKHDNCYASCIDKAQCEAAYFNCLEQTCARLARRGGGTEPNLIDYRDCVRQAILLFDVVASLGRRAYCACCPGVGDCPWPSLPSVPPAPPRWNGPVLEVLPWVGLPIMLPPP
jgi:hypothetical protein